jgi:hypothetical protein
LRGWELDEALEQLLRLGLIEPTSQLAALQPIAAEGYVAALATEPPRAATSVPEFEKVREEASRFVAERLGEAGTPICACATRSSGDAAAPASSLDHPVRAHANPPPLNSRWTAASVVSTYV